MKRMGVALGAVLAFLAGLGPIVWEVAHDTRPGARVAPLTSYDDDRLERREGEADLEYAARANAEVGAAIVHCDSKFGPQTWAVAALDLVTRGGFTRESADAYPEGVIHPAGLRCGYCSQHALVLAEVLRLHGLEADAYQLGGHVVTTFEVDGQSYAVDPDLDVGPFAVDWSDGDQLREAATVAYAESPAPFDAGWAVPIYADTSEDAGVYPRGDVELIADQQGRALAAVELLRWGLLGAGVVLVGVALRFSRSSG